MQDPQSRVPKVLTSMSGSVQMQLALLWPEVCRRLPCIRGNLSFSSFHCPGEFTMINMHKCIAFLMAFVLVTFALPSVAHDSGGSDTINLVMGVAGSNQLTASIKHNDKGDLMKSFKLPFGTNVQSVSVTGLTISPNPPSSLPTVSVTGAGATGLISVATGLGLKYGQTLKLTLSVTTTATANCGSTTSTWTATGWEGTSFNGERFPLASTGNVLTANINGACTLTYAAGAGGTISGITPQTVAYGGSGTQVTAVPSSGYGFVSWSDGVLTAARTDTNVTASKSVTASFAQVAITTAVSPAGSGTLSCDPNPIPYNGTTTCTASAGAGYGFVNFSGDCSGTSCILSNVTSTKSVTANFAQNAISAAAIPAAGGSVNCTPNPVPYNGNSSCTASVNPNYTFIAFSGDCTGATCALSNVTSPKNVTGNYVANTMTISSTATSAAVGPPVTTYPVTVTLTGGPQNATVTLIPSGCPAFTGALSAAASGGVASFQSDVHRRWRLHAVSVRI